jgi:hypothetical protein
VLESLGSSYSIIVRFSPTWMMLAPICCNVKLNSPVGRVFTPTTFVDNRTSRTILYCPTDGVIGSIGGCDSGIKLKGLPFDHIDYITGYIDLFYRDYPGSVGIARNGEHQAQQTDEP